jgi:hypothetical protein
MKRSTKTQTNKPMQSIQSQVTEAMKQNFIECRKNLTKDEILEHLSDFSSRKVKKAWLSKRINDRVVYLNLLAQASTEGWKHFYGQPIHQKFIELQMATLQSMIDIRLSFDPQSERESLKETFLRPFLGSEAPKQPKVEVKEPKVESKPKVSKQLATAKEQPKVVKEQSTIDNEVLTKIVHNLSELSSQVTRLTELCLTNSKAIAELQSQPKVADKPKKQPKVATTQPKVETVAVVTPAKPKVSRKQPKVENSQISIFDAIFKTNAPKYDKKSVISHEDAFEHRSDVEKSVWRKFRMEVK